MNDLMELANELLNQYKENIEKSGHSASGELVDTAKATVEYNGQCFTVYFNLQDYWKNLEYGTKPHFPPLDKLEEWIRVKRLVPRSYNGKVPTTRQLAYVIGRKISQVGTPATNLLTKTLEESQVIDKMVEIIQNKFQEEINKEEI